MKSSSSATAMTTKEKQFRSGEVADSDEEESDLRNQVTDLARSVHRLTEDNTATNMMIKEMNQAISVMMKTIGKMPMRDTSPPAERYPTSPQVDPSYWEPQGSNPVGYRSEALNLANRDSMLKKGEMPCCDGSGVLEWITDVEYFFTLGGYSEGAKLDLVPLCLQGALKKWYSWVKRRGGVQELDGF